MILEQFFELLSLLIDALGEFIVTFLQGLLP